MNVGGIGAIGSGPSMIKKESIIVNVIGADMSPTEFKSELNEVDRLLREMAMYRSELLKQCPHSELEEKSYYFSGSYLDRAYTDSWKQCKCCGKKFDEKTVEHDWFG